MSVNIIRKFWNGAEYKDLSKIVFTSSNIDSPAAAGTRSHVLPGSNYIGTWYEALDLQYIIKRHQDAPSTVECLYNQVFLHQQDFTFGTDVSATVISRYDITTTTGIVYYDSVNKAVLSSVTNDGYFTTVTGVEETFNKYKFYFSSTTGDTTVSGSNYYLNELPPTVSGSNIMPAALYLWQDNNNTEAWATPQNSIIFEVTFGEAYNCRLTAWDDETHSTTNNELLTNRAYKVVSCVYHACAGTKQLPTMDTTTDTTLVFPPCIDMPLAGDDSYYGDFDMWHVADGGTTGTEHGVYLYFTPRLYDINSSYSSGNYDFVTTLHYQYT